MNSLIKILRTFAENTRTGGLTEEEYGRVRPMLLKNNYQTWRRVTPLCTLYFAVLTLLSLFIGTVSANTAVYLAMTALFGAFSVILAKRMTSSSGKLMPFLYEINVSLLIFAVIIGAVMQKKHPSVTFIALMIVLPQITLGLPWVMDSIIIVAAVICSVCSTVFKQPEVRNLELFNILCFCILSVILNTHILKERFSGFLNQYNVEADTYRDALTGVKNNTAYQKEKEALQRRLSAHPEEEFALIVADLNSLKRINDTYGHEHGDDFIVRSCQKLCEVFMHSPVYRIGGDEFTVFLRGRDYKHRAALISMAEQCCESAENSSEPWNRADFALGLAEHNQEAGDDFDEVFRRADKAMYASKKRIYADRARRKNIMESSTVIPEDQRRRILLIDDDEETRKSVADVLKKQYRVCEASDGQEGLSFLRNPDSVSLVLLNYSKDGISFLKMLQDDLRLSEVPVIVLSDEPENAEDKCFAMGAKDIIEPGCSPDVLLRRVNNFIQYREAREALHAVEFDSLTGVLTRQGFLRRMEKMLTENPQTDYSLMVTDVEDFNSFIERYGMETGDELLQKIAEGLRAAVGQDGLLGRIGVDRFGCLMPDEKMDSVSGLPAVYRRLSEKEVFAGIRFVGKASVYEHVDHTMPPMLLINRGMSALGSIRHQYERSLTIFNEDVSSSQERISRMEQDMRIALDKGQFKVYYQPKHDTATGRLMGAEALLRWVHPVLGLLSPQEFIPLFERNGFITHADLFAWKRTCENLNRWQKKGLKTVPVSVNTSRRDFELADLMERLRAMADENNVDHSLLHIEVTETLFAQRAELLRSRLEEAHKSGFAVELDDFGTGYSSLAMLSDMPLDIVKLDISFVEHEIGVKRARILAATVNLAHSLGLGTIAEGVETQQQRDLLQTLGCGSIQGFYFSKPIPEEEFEKYLRRCSDDGMKEPQKSEAHGSRCYVIDGDYNIVRFNREAAEMYPQLTVGKKCYQCLVDGKKPCDVCPVKNGVIGPTTYLDPLRGVYESVDAVEVSLEDGSIGHALVLSDAQKPAK